MNSKMYPIFVIFPYIKTSKEIELFGLKFRNSKDLNNIPNDIKKHLSILLKMFYLRNNLRLTDMVFLYECCKTPKDINSFIHKVVMAQYLLTYLYSAPHPTNLEPFIEKELLDFYIFRLDLVSKYLIIENKYVEPVGKLNYPKLDNFERFNGYEGILNNQNTFWVTKGSRIYPTIPHLSLRYHQDLYNDFNSANSKTYEICKLFYEKSFFNNDEIQNRFFNALKWYNLSLVRNTPEENKILNLAIALETLLSIDEKDSVTKRFKESIKLLVGTVEGLDTWIEQFYKTRSIIVHEGYVGQADYLIYRKSINKGNEQSYYRSLLSYGRVIFSICFNAILSGMEMTYKIKLPQLFKTNQERFKELCKFLDNKKDFNFDDYNYLLDLTNELKEYSHVGETSFDKSLILSCMKNLSINILKETEGIPQNIVSKLKILSSKVPNRKDEEEYYKRLESIMQINRNIDLNTNNILLKIFYKIAYASTNYILNEYFNLDRKFNKNNQKSNRS